jgi:glycosyltransferase involved in cell wall biosynthesis
MLGIRRRAGRGVLIIVENLPVPFDRRVWQEARTLRDAGYRVSVICPAIAGYAGGHHVIEDIHVYRHPLPIEARGVGGYALEYSAALAFEFLLAWRVLFTRGFDVIQACNPPDTIFLVGGFFKALFRKKFVFDHHDLSPELYDAKGGGNGLARRLLLRLERLTFRTADASIATNDSYRRVAIERGGMPEARTFVVRSGPDLRRLVPGPPVEELKHGRRYLVGYLGVIGAQEGVQYLLRAASRIVHELGRDDVHFTLVGGGTDLERMRQLAHELRLDDFVSFTGRVPDEEMLAVLNTADVCVNPDEYNVMNDRSTMNKVLEYMALGKPIVQFDLTEGRVSAAESSLYAKRNDPVDFASRILELLADPALREAMGRIGRERVEQQFSWERQAPRLLEAYSSLWSETRSAQRETDGEWVR